VTVRLPGINEVVSVKVVTQRGVEAYYTTFISIASVGSVWWDPNWSYRAPVVINNTLNSNTLKDYQVLVTLDTQTLISQGKMRSDCDDIRVVDGAGNQLSYWIEPGTCNTRNTKIWVLSIPFFGFSCRGMALSSPSGFVTVFNILLIESSIKAY
jgi:hypothetical protein